MKDDTCTYKNIIQVLHYLPIPPCLQATADIQYQILDSFIICSFHVPQEIFIVGQSLLCVQIHDPEKKLVPAGSSTHT